MRGEMSLQQTRTAPGALGEFGPELFNAPALVAVFVFGLNNLLLKSTCPGWLTGKLSDVTACCFLPLLLSALIDLGSGRRARLGLRLGMGLVVTTVVFAAVKLDVRASDALNWLTTVGNHALGLQPSRNYVDPTDLLALPFAGLGCVHGWVWAKKHAEAVE